jgi:hypothetical protein
MAGDLGALMLSDQALNFEFRHEIHPEAMSMIVG